MKGKILTLISSAALLAFQVSGQNLIGNGSFELPGSGKVKGWNGDTPGYSTDIPSWASDTAAVDSGVESDWPGHTDGVYSGYLMSGDPSVWQFSSHIIGAGELFTLTLDARDNYTATAPANLLINIVYNNGGNRVVASTTTVALTGTWTGYSLNFDPSSLPASIGDQIGVELKNVSAPSSWIGLDNVQLHAVPEPTSLALLGFGSLAMMVWRKRS